MELLMPEGFEDPAVGYGYTATVFEQVASGERPATFSISPSIRHVGVTRRDTHRPGFGEAVRAANREGYPVLVRGAGGGAIAGGPGTFGFSIIRPPEEGEDLRLGIRERYDEAASIALAAFARLGIKAEVGEVSEEFCPGDQSVRVGGFENGMKLSGIAGRVTRRAASVGGIVLVSGEKELARILGLVYSAMDLPLRPASVGSLQRAGSTAGLGEAMEAFAAEAESRYGATRVSLDGQTLRTARGRSGEYPVEATG